ncbi:MAG TPA: hypothetical protein VF510_13145 [Ktedonobacterales bacterium]
MFGSRRGARGRHGPLVNQGRVGAGHEYTEIRKYEVAKLLTGGPPLTNVVIGHKAVEEYSEIKTVFVSYP